MKVKCTVDSCKYWKGNFCNAPTIEVGSQNMEMEPERSDHTMCITFKSEN